jgi:hypothetical protein
MLETITSSRFKYNCCGITFKDNEIDSVKIYFVYDVSNYNKLFELFIGYLPSYITSELYILKPFPCIAIKIRKNCKSYLSFYHCISENPNRVIGFDLIDNKILERSYLYIQDKNSYIERCEGTTIRNNKEINYHKRSYIPAIELPLNSLEKDIYEKIKKNYTIVSNCIDSEGYKAIYFLDTICYTTIELLTEFILKWLPTYKAA